MTNSRVLLIIALMAAVTYLIRCAPFLLFRNQIKSRFVQSFLYYMPFGVLAAMIVPDIFTSTNSVYSACAGFLAALLLSLKKRSLLLVAVCAVAAAFLTELLLSPLAG